MPSLTLAILAVFYIGDNALIAIFAGSFMVTLSAFPAFGLMGPAKLLPALIISVGASLAAFMGGRCLGIRIRDRGGHLFSANRLFAFLIFVVLIPSVVNAFFISLAEFLFSRPTEIFLRFILWAQAGGIGIILIIPFVIAWSGKVKLHMSRNAVLELVILLAILTPFIILSSSDKSNNPVKNFLAGYFLLPVYLWLAIRFNSKITTLVMLASMVLLILLTMVKTNYYVLSILDHPDMLLQGFMLVIILVTYLTHSFFSERVRLIQSFSQSESNLKAVIENMPVALAIMDKNGEKGYLNHNFIRLTGYQRDDLPTIEVWFEKAYPDEDYRRKVKETWSDVVINLPEAGTIEQEFRIVTKDGDRKDILFVMSLLEEKLLVALSDMTQRKRMVERIVESERRMNTLVQNLQGMVFQCKNNHGRTMSFVSEGAFSLTGYLPSDFTSERMDFSQLIVEKFRDMVWDSLQVAIRKGEPYEIQYQITTREGNVKWVAERGKGFYNEKGVCIGIEGLIIDITERITILESLRKSEQRYKSLFENIPLSLWEDDYSQAVNYLRELPVQNAADLRDYLIADTSRIKELVKRIRIIDLNRSSVKLYGEDSRDKLVQSMDRVFVEEHYESLVDLMVRLMNGETYIENNATSLRIGYQLKTLSISWYVMPGHEADLSRVLVTIVDVTDLTKAKQAILELNQQLEEKVVKRTMELNRANKELEAFSYSVSHDLKAPLRAIKGFSSLLKTEVGDHLEDKALRYLNHVTDNVDNMAKLINDLLQFSRLGRKSLNVREVDTAAVVASVWEELTGIEQERKCRIVQTGLPVIYADEPMLRQVFVNLLSNAVKFSVKKTIPQVKVTGTRSDQNWLFSVEDNGIGFEQRFEEKIFKVFQRLHTQEEYEGSGVGLALVQRIVHRHGGNVWAEGDPDKGSIFFFTVPVEIDSE